MVIRQPMIAGMSNESIEYRMADFKITTVSN